MKSLGYAIVFGLIGGLIGLMAGSGETSYVKKSQREIAFPIYAIGGALLGIVGGIIIGSKVNEENKQEKQFGFNYQETMKYQVGRKWEYETTFTNPVSGKKNSIKTAYSKENDTVLTYLNNVPILNHETKSGADNIIQKEHTKGVNYAKNKIKTSELNLI